MSRVRGLVAAAFVVVAVQAVSAEKDKETSREGGIVGTGIVGTVLGSGAIQLTELNIGASPTAPLETPFEARDADDLEVGETILLEALRGDEDWDVTRVAMYYPLIGPAEVASEGTVRILGTPIVVRAEGRSASEFFDDGQWYAVSGLWHYSGVVATHIRAVAERDFAQITGSYLGGNGDGSILIGETRLLGDDLPDLELGDVLRVVGVPTEEGLAVERADIGLFESSVDVTISEGYLSPPDPTGYYTVLGAGGRAQTTSPGMINSSSVGVYCRRFSEDTGLDVVKTVLGLELDDAIDRC